jgi:5'(3')-deoxyribonucleotidase
VVVQKGNNMAKPPIFLDYDDVLVNFIGPVLDVVNGWENSNLKHGDVLTYSYLPDTYGHRVRELWQTYGFYKYVEPFPTSKWFLEKLKERYTINIVTKSHPKVACEKEYHAKFHFGIRDNFFSVEGCKSKFTEGGILIDDATHNIQDHILTNNQPGILFNMNGQNGWSKPTIQHRLLRMTTSHAGALKLLGF